MFKAIKTSLLLLLLIFLVFWGYSACNEINEENETNHIDLQLPAMYTGFLPCADCPGIEYILVLEESGFTEISWYRDRSPQSFTTTGNWTLSGDTLRILNSESSVVKTFLADKEKLVLLDRNNQGITGDLAKNYVLERTADQESIRQHHNKLTEEGVLFYATGNEPFWSLQIDTLRQVTFKRPAVTKNFGIADSTHSNGYVYFSVLTDSTEIEIVAEETYCQDSMSGFLFSQKVMVHLHSAETDTLNGCGLFLSS